MFQRKFTAATAALVFVLTSGVAFAGAFTNGTQRVETPVRTTGNPAASASAQPTALPIVAPNHRALPPLPPMPTGSSHYRRIKNATGACIVFTAFDTNCGQTTLEENFVTGEAIAWKTYNLPTGTGVSHTDYYALATNGNASSTTTLTAAGASYTTAASPNTYSVTPAVNGIYVFASLNNSTNSWDAIAYILVGPQPNIETYTDGTLSTKTQTYTTNASGTGVTVYVAATVLDTTDTYMVGIEDQLTGACVYTGPSSAQTTITGAPYHLCNLTSSAATGAVPNNNGLILANWAVTLGSGTVPPEGGTYVATIYDQTTGVRVASRQFTIIDGRTTAGSARVWLQAYTSGGGQTTCGTVAADELGSGTTASSTRIAWNGLATNVDDQNFTGMHLCIGADNLATYYTDTYEIVVADPTGNVATEYSGTAQPSTAGVCSGAGNCIPPTYNESFQLPSSTTIPFEQAYPGSTWTATVYDKTLGKMVAEQSFQILGYTATWDFTTPSESTTLNISSGTTQATSLLITNTSDLTFGTNNGDSEFQFFAVLYAGTGGGVSDITMQSPSQSSPCDPKTNGGTCSATYYDSAGNAWTVNDIYSTSANLVAFQVLSTTAPLKPGSTLNITGLTFTASGCTGNSCEWQTTEVATHALDVGLPSSGGQVSNYFLVVNGSATTAGTAAVGLAGYYNSTAPTTFVPIKDAYTPRCASNESNCTTAGTSQALLANNQPYTNAASKVVLAYKLTNTSASGTYIRTFDIIPPAGFNLATAAIDANSPNTGTLTNNGYCGSAQVAAACITVSGSGIPSGSTDTFYIDFTPPSSSFSYADVVGTIIYTQTGQQLAVPITPTTSSVATFIGSPTTVDSTAIGAYSLNGGLMTAGVTPSTVGTSTTNTLNFDLRNTTSGADPFPDEVDMVAVQFPSTSAISVPSSCTNITTSTTGWSCEYVNVSAGVTTMYFGQCPQQVNPVPVVPASSTSLGSDALTVCPFASPNEPYSLTAGATFTASIPVTAGSAAASNITISSFGHGATTGAWSTPITTSFSVVTTAAAGAGFSSITGANGVLTPTAQGNEPSVTGDYQGTSPNNYDTYVYKIVNTGSTGITSATIAIPSEDSTGTNGADSSGTIWNVTATPTLVIERTGNANGCTDTYTNPTSGVSAPGSINITCPSGDFNAGDTLDVTFTAKTPLKINSTYAFTPTINGSASGVSANWTDDEDILISLSATLTVNVNPSMTCGGTASPGSGYPIATTANETVNFGAIGTGKYEYCKDAMIVQVTTDAANPTNWSLYASTSGNPTATGALASASGTTTTESAANELLISMDAASSTGGAATVPAASIPCPSGSGSASCFSYDNTSTYAAMALTSSGTGTRLGYTTNGGTGVNNASVTFDVNYQVAVGTETVPTTGEQETITYTWIAN